MTKWQLPEGRRPISDEDLAALTRRLVGTSIDYRELYNAAKHDAKEAELYAAELEASHAEVIKRLERLSHWLDITDEELTGLPADQLPDDHRHIQSEVNAALAELRVTLDGE
jgi:vacuolar-type H+-ATPase subunit E/Vma4